MRTCFSLLLLSVGFASAQTAPTTMTIGDVAVTGSVRTRVYAWDWFEPTTGNNEYGYSGTLVRVNFLEKRKTWDWDLELAAPILLGLPNDATAPAPQGALGLGSNYYTANGNSQYSGMVFAKQAYVRFKGLGASEANNLQIGRFEFNDGTELAPKNDTLATLKRDRISQRLIGTFGWSDVGRSFDGLHYSYTKSKDDFTVVTAVPTRGAYQTDGWGWNRAAFGYAAYTHESGSKNHQADSRIFFIDYDDWRHIVKTDNRPAAVKNADKYNIRIETFGAHSIHELTTGPAIFDGIVWAAVQTGRWGTQKQLAYAMDVEGGFQPQAQMLRRLRPWIRGGYTIGSGDGNPNDSRHGTFFQVLPTPRPYARFPFFNMMNTEDRFGSLILRPHAKWTISNEFHALRLSNASDLWYSGGGVYQPWTFGYTGRATSGKRSLGNLYDSSIEFRANRKMTFTGYVGYTQGLAAMEQIYPKGKDGEFGYLEALIRF